MTKLQTALKQIPDIIGELRGYVTPGKTGSTGRSAPATTPSAPIAISPVDDADELYAALREHADCIADQIGTKRPASIGRYVRGEKGLPANTPPETAFVNARTLARFIEHQLPMVQDDDLRSEISRDLISRWGRVSNRYPSKAPREHVQIRCVACDLKLVYMHGPRSYGGDETFSCDSCGRWHTEQEVAEQLVIQEKELAKKRRKK